MIYAKLSWILLNSSWEEDFKNAPPLFLQFWGLLRFELTSVRIIKTEPYFGKESWEEYLQDSSMEVNGTIEQNFFS